jgi:murein DD-endopeptidase MepM/ murein hydrolase activator NlpD
MKKDRSENHIDFEEEELTGLYHGLRQDIRRSRLPKNILQIGLILLGVIVVAAIPLYFVIEKQEKIDTLEQKNETIANTYSQVVENQKRKISKFRRLYEEGILELEDKIERIERNSPHLLTDTKEILNKFKKAVGPTTLEDAAIEELFYLVSNHPETVHEAIYQRLIDTSGIQKYEPKYEFFQPPLAHNGRTIVTSEYGQRMMVMEEFDRAELQKSRASYRVPGYGGGWVVKKKDGEQFLTKVTYHSGYDLVNDTDSSVYARHNGKIVADFNDYGTYGRTIFYEYRHGSQIYRVQLSHLERGPRTFRKGQRVEAGDVLGYVGETGNATGPHLHWSVWKPNPERPGRWITVDVYPKKILKYNNILYIDKIRE